MHLNPRPPGQIVSTSELGGGVLTGPPLPTTTNAVKGNYEGYVHFPKGLSVTSSLRTLKGHHRLRHLPVPLVCLLPGPVLSRRAVSLRHLSLICVSCK